ncbi:hypothetical protein LINPERPRIM_LOCUS8985 [Linum perenne]
MRNLEETWLNSLAPSAAEVTPPASEGGGRRYSGRSIETLVVVLAVIIIAAVFAGFVARLCGIRRSGEHDVVEGSWIERRCRSCIDGGVKPPPATEEPKK